MFCPLSYIKPSCLVEKTKMKNWGNKNSIYIETTNSIIMNVSREPLGPALNISKNRHS